MTKHLNFRISGQKINTRSKVRYLGVILEEHIDWNLHINSLKCKLNRAIGILSKIRHYVPKFLLNTLYYTNIPDYIKLLNCLFVRDLIAQSTIPAFQEFFIQMRDTHQHNTRHATQNTVTLNQYKTAFYGIRSIKHQSALIWNQINNEAPSDLLQKSRSEIREYITNKLISNY